MTCLLQRSASALGHVGWFSTNSTANRLHFNPADRRQSGPPDALANHEIAARGKRPLADASAGLGGDEARRLPPPIFFKYCFLRANMALV